MHPAFRGDIAQPRRRRFRFRQVKRGREREKLPVYVAQRHGVLIEKIQRSHPAPAERLGAPRADAAEPEHRYAAFREFFHRRVAEDRPGAAETFVHFLSFHFIKTRREGSRRARLSKKPRRVCARRRK